MSQEEFADMCDLDRTYVGGIERGERNVALVNIEKIAKTLKLSLSELFRGVLLAGLGHCRLEFRRELSLCGP